MVHDSMDRGRSLHPDNFNFEGNGMEFMVIERLLAFLIGFVNYVRRRPRPGLEKVNGRGKRIRCTSEKDRGES